MAGLIIKIHPQKLKNADTDLRYILPEKLEETTNGNLQDDGFDYLQDDSLVVFMTSTDPEKDAEEAFEYLKNETILGNSILESAIIAIENEEGIKVIFPEDFSGDFSIED